MPKQNKWQLLPIVVAYKDGSCDLDDLLKYADENHIPHDTIRVSQPSVYRLETDAEFEARIIQEAVAPISEGYLKAVAEQYGYSLVKKGTLDVPEGYLEATAEQYGYSLVKKGTLDAH